MINFGIPGLLSVDDQEYVKGQGLLGLAGNLLANAGPSATPRNFAQIAGQGLMGYQQGLNQSTQNLFQNRMAAAKLDEIKEQKIREDKLRELIGSPAEPSEFTPMIRSGTGTGFLGGKMQLPEFYAAVAGLGGDYTKLGMSGLNAIQEKNNRGDYFQFLPTTEGYMVGNARSGEITSPGRKVVPAQYDPSLQGDISRSRKYGEVSGETGAISEVKKPQQAKDMLSLLTQAETLIDKSTGSIAGAGADIVAGSVGYATEGAKANAKLKVIQASLMTSMPRMEGPQSDRDVQLYREAAGQIGDSTVPNDIKKAALETIRVLNERYTKGSKNPPKNPNANNQGWSIRKK